MTGRFFNYTESLKIYRDLKGSEVEIPLKIPVK